MPRRRPDQWSVVAAGLLCSHERVERNIRQYRRRVRLQLLGLIQELERGICQIGGDYFPLRVPPVGSAMRDYLSELLKATNQYRFVIRHWEGGRVVGRVPFWGYSATNCGLDELINGPGIDYWGKAAPDEGQLDVYEQFAQLVRTNRELRGRGGVYGMISNGIESSVARLLSEGNPLAELILLGTPEEAADAVMKELAGLMGGPYSYLEMSEVEQDARRSAYLCMQVSNVSAEDDCLGLLEDYDRALLALSEAIVGEPWRLVARKLGMCLNEEPVADVTEPQRVAPETELIDGSAQLARVIELPRRRARRRRIWPLGVAVSQ